LDAGFLDALDLRAALIDRSGDGELLDQPIGDHFSVVRLLVYRRMPRQNRAVPGVNSVLPGNGVAKINARRTNVNFACSSRKNELREVKGLPALCSPLKKI